MLNLTLVLSTLITPPAQAAGKLPLACLTNDVIAFGASVTQATAAVIPAYGQVVNGVELYGQRYGKAVSSSPDELIAEVPTKLRPFGLSPVRYIVKGLGGKAALENVSYVGKYFTASREDLGSAQIEELLTGKRRGNFADAGLLVGLDAFYWDAIFGNCGYGRNFGAEIAIKRLTAAAGEAKKVLVLGNVPFENENNVRINGRRTGVDGFWEPPMPGCVRSINETIARECRIERGCYIVDLADLAARLNRGEKLSLAGDPRAYGLYDLRPDGIHMSDKGTRYIAERALTALYEHPPTCPPAKNRRQEKEKLMEELGLPL